MVVLAAAICTKAGRALLSRQFVEMTRIRIEGLLAAFPKLISGGLKQHTFIETESVRYVYQPMEGLFLLLITTKASNIVEDLETLRLMSKVVPDVAGGLKDEDISKKCFDLIFAFDEVINSGGHKENITIQQMRTNMEMESHEEKLHNMIKQSKMDTAKEEMKRKANAIKEAQRKDAQSGMGGLGGGSMPGLGNAALGKSFGSAPSEGADAPEVIQNQSSFSTPAAAPTPPVKIKKKSGMSLSKGKKGMSMLEKMAGEENINLAAAKASMGATDTAAAAAAPPPVPVSNDPVFCAIEEKVAVQMNREGSVEGMEIKGSLSLTANNEESAKCKIQMQMGANSDFKFQTHPKISKPNWEKDSVLGLKDASKPFPVGKAVGVLRWNRKPNEPEAPLTINCWPEDEGDQMNVNVEYSLERDVELRDINILIPLGTSDAPSIENIDGVHKHNSKEGYITWHLDFIDQSNSTGSLEFNIQQSDVDAFFPVQVSFSSPTTYCDLEIGDVLDVGSDASIRFGKSKTLIADNYTVQSE